MTSFFTGTNTSCDQLTTWTCPRGHAFSDVPQCKQGIPQDCPDCSLDKAEQFLRALKSDKEFFNRKPFYSGLQGLEIQTLSTANYKKRFLDAVSEVFRDFSIWAKSRDPWMRPIFKRKLIHCFIALNQSQMKAESFEPK